MKVGYYTVLDNKLVLQEVETLPSRIKKLKDLYPVNALDNKLYRVRLTENDNEFVVTHPIGVEVTFTCDSAETALFKLSSITSSNTSNRQLTRDLVREIKKSMSDISLDIKTCAEEVVANFVKLLGRLELDLNELVDYMAVKN